MRIHLAVVILLGIIGAACVAPLLTAAQSDAPAASNPPGRYQGAVTEGQVWLFDSTTGECWRALPYTNQQTWQRAVPPLSATAKRASEKP